MKLTLLGVGRLKAGPERELFDRYCGRVRALSRKAGIGGLDVIEVDEGRGRTAEERKREEAAALIARLSAVSCLLLLDERGSGLTSQAFAGLIGKTRDAGAQSFVLAIGGPDGFDEVLHTKADATLAFGAATIPHQLVRVLAAEQIYRALTILTGHPYHRS